MIIIKLFFFLYVINTYTGGFYGSVVIVRKIFKHQAVLVTRTFGGGASFIIARIMATAVSRCTQFRCKLFVGADGFGYTTEPGSTVHSSVFSGRPRGTGSDHR